MLSVSAIALTKPNSKNYEYVIDDPDDRIVAVLTAADIAEFHDCHLDGESTVIPSHSWDFPYIQFDGINQDFSCAVLKLKDNVASVNIFFNSEEGEAFLEKNNTTLLIQSGDDDAVYPSYPDISSKVRIGSFETFSFESLELHTAAPKLIETKNKTSPVLIVCCLLFGLAGAFAVYLLDNRFCFSDKIIRTVSKQKKQLISVLLGAAACTALALLTEYILYYIRLRSSAEAFYNPYEAVIVFSVLNIFAALFIFRKRIGKKPEGAFLCIMLTLCLLLVLLCPFGHVSWDDKLHYRWVLNASYLGPTSYVTEADRRIMAVAEDYKVKGGYAENAERIGNMNACYDSPVYTRDGTTTIAHAPDGLILALCRLADLSFSKAVTMSKLGSALVYCIVCYYAMRRLKSGKMILAVVAMFPTALFLASNFSYDYWVNCFSILGMAYFVGNLQEKNKPISIADTLIMCACFAIASLPKPVYAVLLVIPFFMTPKKIKNKKQYYAICVSFLIILTLFLAFKSFTQIGGGGDSRGGDGVSTIGQIQYIIANPLVFVKTVLRLIATDFLSHKKAFFYTVSYAFTGTGKGSYIVIALMAFTAVTDKNKYDFRAYGWPIRAMAIAVYFGTAFILAAAMYITFTPVGHNTVNGCQYRYIIPVTYPLLSLIGWGGLKNRIPGSIYNIAVMAIMSALNIYNIVLIMLPFVS